MNIYAKDALVRMPIITFSDATQRRLWENLRDLRDVSEEIYLINLLGGSWKFVNQPSLRCLWDTEWDVWDKYPICIHAGWVTNNGNNLSKDLAVYNRICWQLEKFFWKYLPSKLIFIKIQSWRRENIILQVSFKVSPQISTFPVFNKFKSIYQ